MARSRELRKRGSGTNANLSVNIQEEERGKSDAPRRRASGSDGQFYLHRFPGIAFKSKNVEIGVRCFLGDKSTREPRALRCLSSLVTTSLTAARLLNFTTGNSAHALIFTPDQPVWIISRSHPPALMHMDGPYETRRSHPSSMMQEVDPHQNYPLPRARDDRDPHIVAEKGKPSTSCLGARTTVRTVAPAVGIYYEGADQETGCVTDWI